MPLSSRRSCRCAFQRGQLDESQSRQAHRSMRITAGQQPKDLRQAGGGRGLGTKCSCTCDHCACNGLQNPHLQQRLTPVSLQQPATCSRPASAKHRLQPATAKSKQGNACPSWLADPFGAASRGLGRRARPTECARTPARARSRASAHACFVGAGTGAGKQSCCTLSASAPPQPLFSCQHLMRPIAGEVLSYSACVLVLCLCASHLCVALSRH